MSITFGNLKVIVARVLRDPSAKAFLTADLGDLINESLSEVGRIAPQFFQEDITPVADTLSYIILSGTFGGVAEPEIEVARVELWDVTTTPDTRRTVITPASAGYAADSEAGWMNWGGRLYIPGWAEALVSGAESNFLYRLWGWAPYPQVSADGTVIAVSAQAQWAVVQYATVLGLNRLIGDRTLFTQWQTRAGNTDTSLAGLMNDLNIARDEWRRHSRALIRLRSLV